MTTLYIERHDVMLRKDGQRLTLTQGEEKLASMPASKVRQVVLFGNGTLTPAALDLVLENRIDVAYLTAGGRLRGRIQPPLSSHVELRRAQYEKAGDGAFRLDFARRIVEAKIRNGRALLLPRLRASQGAGSAPASRLKHYRKLASSAKSIDEARGYEGIASSEYFRAFAKLLKDPMGFRARVKPNPRDPVNIMLSLGYTLLFNHLDAMIRLAGLDPYQGLYHEVRAGHAALASDLAEEFRAPVVDAVVLNCVNLGVVRRTDFEAQGERLVFKKEGLRKFLEACDARFRQFSGFAHKGRKLDFRRLFEHQCRHLARVLDGRNERYEPFQWR